MDTMLFQALKTHKRKVILDTDIGPDVDDVGAVAVLFSLAKKYNIDIIGLINCTSNTYGSGALDALSQFCGFSDIPIGQYEKEGFLTEGIFYNKFLSEHFSDKFMNKTLKIHGAVPLYRKLLSEAEDKSIMLITIGPLSTVFDLYESKGDSYSPLSGKELIEQKVYAIVPVAASFPEGLDWNVKMHIPAAKAILENCSVPVFYSGHEFGKRFKTGFNGYTPSNWQQNPIYHSYNLYINGRWPEKPRENNCWDLLAVHFAFEGEGAYYALSDRGQVHISSEDGSNTFALSANATQRYSWNSCPLQVLIDELNSLMRWG